MSSSAAMSAAASTGSRHAGPALSPLVARQYSRSIYRCARSQRDQKDRTRRSRSNFSDLSATRSFWEAERERMQQRMEALNADPVGAVFGRKLEPFQAYGKRSGYVQSLLNKPTHIRSMWQTKRGEHSALDYDPVTGQMTPRSPNSGSSHVVDCPPGSEIEAKFVSNPSLVEDGQFQPSSFKPQQPEPITTIRANSVDCSPGSELEVAFLSNPSGFNDAQYRPHVPGDQAAKPNVNITCAPGSELEALFVSETVRSENDQPQLGAFQVQASTKELNADAGLSNRTNIECAPGSELEAMFMSHPAATKDQSRPVEAFGQHMNTSNVPVDCPPGNELDAQFMAQFASVNLEADTKASSSIDCSPGSEIEAMITFEAQNEGASIDCPPGSELEAKFIADPAAAEDGQFQPGLMAHPSPVKAANVSVDCMPGDELVAKFLSEAASVNAEALTASAIHARYTSKESQREFRPLRFDGSEDRVGDFLAQNEALVQDIEAAATYRILSYDVTSKQVTASEADSFFGSGESRTPNQVLSRLHNPSKFTPYLEQLQRDGYEIATGGGDILVLRKFESSMPGAQDSSELAAANAEIAKHIRHDSFQSTPKNNKSRVVTRQETVFTGGPPNWSPWPPTSSAAKNEAELSTFSQSRSSSSSSTSHAALQRMLLAGTATAASCYAIAVVTEFFRTGGADGRGIDAFTAFESERRRYRQ
ncbi:hypothetical protein N7510_010103 [Penicillium lagena]|uniref:uncharacterized protein n=1 Tax=Penicillium lagena TaxID=94218 RepID=UPI00254108D5|nr:uncharacterized protein N7510_010103 [Penicillium lagena]KAJ5604949.1 hypothetical protein N7510_010103 [Penicillium lagena]